MKEIREKIEAKYSNALIDLENGHYSNRDGLIGNIEAYMDLLALIPKPRTEEEVLKEFEDLGYSFQETKFDDVDTLAIGKDKRLIYIYKNVKRYRLVAFNRSGTPTPDVIGIQEHKLLNELFECWGWI